MTAAKVANIKRSFNKFNEPTTDECKPFIVPAAIVLLCLCSSILLVGGLVISRILQ